ncbi:hypothetical protein M3Y98_00087500 [Aphelenchoides besseyi]|nr:hypothetical protein M3Y98_00087500 [Aphelenchoides besseyi]KAI6198474.1 hypothetical protein M3Y96_00523000 [Aphelenchoides besseyi]
MPRFTVLVLLLLLIPMISSMQCYYCGNKKDCENPRTTNCERGSCAKIERGESLQKGCYMLGNEMREEESKCEVDVYQRNICTCSSDFCNIAPNKMSIRWLLVGVPLISLIVYFVS